jgi:uncharacterized protein (DUF2141 family)
MKRPFHALACALVIAAALSACDDDDPAAPPTTGAVSGTVTFQGAWPSTGDVQISIFSSFPPTGPPDAFTDPITQAASYDYSIAGLTPGAYAAVVVGWRDPLNPSTAEILGMHWEHVDSVAVDSNGDPRGFPLPLTIEAGQTDANINMLADLDVAP